MRNPFKEKKTAKNLLKWINSWTPEQREGYHKLADSVEQANRKETIQIHIHIEGNFDEAIERVRKRLQYRFA